jgi:hypothetical protein
MKKIFLLLCSSSLLILSCKKSVSVETTDNGIEDSAVFSTGDILTYEVITKDPGGWFGIWTDSSGNVEGTPLDSINYGSPVYNASGWKYSFKWNGYSSQLMMSVAARTYQDDITINLYRNNELVASATNDQMKGVAKILYNIKGDSLQGTTAQPLLTYEVLLSNIDTSKFESDGWWGGWTNKNGDNTFTSNPLAMDFAIPSGWRYSFRVASLPFTMSMQTSPYTKGGSTVILNFYVNNILVKTNSSNDLIYPPITYTVQ